MSRALTPRQTRALKLLKTGNWTSREVLDCTAGVSNGPGTVSQLRRKLGYDAIETRLVPVVDRDGKTVLAGQYRLASHALPRLTTLEAANDEQL